MFAVFIDMTYRAPCRHAAVPTAQVRIVRVPDGVPTQIIPSLQAEPPPSSALNGFPKLLTAGLVLLFVSVTFATSVTVVAYLS